MLKKEEKQLNTEVSDESRVYELGFLLDPAVDETELSKYSDEIKGLFKGKKAEFISESPLKLINLSYTIVKKQEGKNERFDTAYFGWIKYEISQDEIEGIDVELKKNESIIRFMLIKTVRENTYIEKKPMTSRRSIFNKTLKSESIIKNRQVKKLEIKKTKTPEAPLEKETEVEIDKAIDELTNKELKA